MTISFGFNIVTCDTGVITADNCHIMHSFITKVLVRQNYSFYLVYHFPKGELDQSCQGSGPGARASASQQSIQ